MAARIPYNSITSTSKLEELAGIADEMWSEAIQLYTDDADWKLVKDTTFGTLVYCKKFNDGKRVVYKAEGAMPLHMDKLMDAFYSRQGLEDLPTWNRSFDLIQVLQEVDEQTFLMYEVTAAAGPGGIVSPRDFVVLVRRKILDGKHVMCYGSIQLDQIPAVEGRVRALIRPSVVVIGPSKEGKADECSFFQTADMDLKLQLVPDAVFHQILKTMSVENTKSLRERCFLVREGMVQS